MDFLIGAGGNDFIDGGGGPDVIFGDGGHIRFASGLPYLARSLDQGQGGRISSLPVPGPISSSAVRDLTSCLAVSVRIF
ncbi:MAG: hypothetical protein AB2814_04160 [Candidatus Sedimenticola endophacoides]